MPHPITNVTLDLTNTAIVTSVAHGLISGASIVVSGVSGMSGVNGAWIITRIDNDTFSLNGSLASGFYTPGTGSWDLNTGAAASATIPGTSTTSGTSHVASASSSAMGGMSVFSGTVPSSFPISNASNTTPIVITTSTPHGLPLYCTVLLSSVGGNTAANGQWLAHVLTSTTFELIGSVGNGTYLASTGIFSVIPGILQIVDASMTDPIVITTSQAHGLINNQSFKVQISGVKGLVQANGIWSYLVLSSTTLSLTDSTGSTGPAFNSSATFIVNPPAVYPWPPVITYISTATPIVVTSLNHSLSTGNKVTLTGAIGNTPANGTWTITKIDSNNFSLNTSVGDAAKTYAGGATYTIISSITKTITGATATTPIKITSATHGLTTGDSITIADTLGSIFGAIGTWFVTVIDANNFTLNSSVGAGQNADYAGSGGTLVLINNQTSIIGLTTPTIGTDPISVTNIIGPALINGAFVQYKIDDGGSVYEKGLGIYNILDNTIIRFPDSVDDNNSGQEVAVNLPSGQKNVQVSTYFTVNTPTNNNPVPILPPPGPGNTTLIRVGTLYDIPSSTGPSVVIAANGNINGANWIQMNGGDVINFDPGPQPVRVMSAAEQASHMIGRGRLIYSLMTAKQSNILVLTPGPSGGFAVVDTASELFGTGPGQPIRVAQWIQSQRAAGFVIIENAAYTGRVGVLTVLNELGDCVAGLNAVVYRGQSYTPSGMLLTAPNRQILRLYAGGSRPNTLPRGAGVGLALAIPAVVWSIVSTPAPTTTKVVMGRLQLSTFVTDSQSQLSDVGRRLYFVPVYMREPLLAKVTLASTIVTDGVSPTWYHAPIVTGSNHTVPSVSIASASPCPFTPLGDKINVQRPVAGIPFDLFLCLTRQQMLNGPPLPPVQGGGGGGVVTPSSTISQPVMFFLNWFSATARHNGLTGADRRGYSLTDNADIGLCLKADLAGTERFMAELQLCKDYLYLYVGTVIAVGDSQFCVVTNTPGSRMIYNQFNRVVYTDRLVDPTLFWPINPNLAQGESSMMNATRPDTWKYWYVNPRDSAAGDQPLENRPGDPIALNGGGGFVQGSGFSAAVRVIGPLGIQIVHRNGTLIGNAGRSPDYVPPVSGATVNRNRIDELRIPASGVAPTLPAGMTQAGGLQYIEVKAQFIGTDNVTTIGGDHWGFMGQAVPARAVRAFEYTPLPHPLPLGCIGPEDAPALTQTLADGSILTATIVYGVTSAYSFQITAQT